jgi:universal stress protein A
MTKAPPCKTDGAVSKDVQESPIQICRILAPTDFSENSRKALNYATKFAQHFGAKLTLLHIYEDPFIYEDTIRSETAQELRKARQCAENSLLALWEEIRLKHPDCDTYFDCGRPDELIVKAAAHLKADLIILSTHDYHWLSHLLFGSDAEHILHRAPCPVLVVHEHERDFLVS